MFCATRKVLNFKWNYSHCQSECILQNVTARKVYTTLAFSSADDKSDQCHYWATVTNGFFLDLIFADSKYVFPSKDCCILFQCFIACCCRNPCMLLQDETKMNGYVSFMTSRTMVSLEWRQVE